MSTSDSHTAFFYGTLMAPSVLHRVIYGPNLSDSTTRPQATNLSIRPAILPDHRRRRVRGADYPAVTPHPASTVRGTIVTGLTEGDIWRLDIFEGDEYARRPVKARLIASEAAKKDILREPAAEELGDEVEAETYVWIAPEEMLEDREWDFEEFVREKMWRWSGEEAGREGEFDDVDKAVQSQEGLADPTGGRHFGGDGNISKMLEESRGKEQEVMESAV